MMSGSLKMFPFEPKNSMFSKPCMPCVDYPGHLQNPRSMSPSDHTGFGICTYILPCNRVQLDALGPCVAAPCLFAG